MEGIKSPDLSQEVDYLEDERGQISAFEFKWQNKTFKPPKAFRDAYPKSKIHLITKDNFQEFLIPS